MSTERSPPGGLRATWRTNGYQSPPRMTSLTVTAAATVDPVPSASGKPMPSPLQPLPDQSLADAVADRLREAIQSGEYSPGQRLVERTLSTELGVSHIPVREALTKLEDEGLVVRLPRRGARVAELSPVSIAEISSMRVVLEGFVVRRVTERWTPRCESDLLRLADRMLAAARRGDIATVLDLDHRYHERLWQQADHSILIEVATTMRGRINSFLRASIQTLSPDELVAHAMTHRTLTEVIAAGDPTAAVEAMRGHIQDAADRIEDRPTGTR